MFKRYLLLNNFVHGENQTIVFNLYLFGLPGSGRQTFIQWLIQNENLLDANFLKSIEEEQKILQEQINKYRYDLNSLIHKLKENLDNFIEEKKFEDANAYFGAAHYRIQETCQAYDEDLNYMIKKSLKNLQSLKNNATRNEGAFFSLDIVGSQKDIIYRIYYNNKKSAPNKIEFNNFLSTIDGLIFIWDISRKIEDNLDVFKEFLENLPPNFQYPLVIALNKIDLPHSINPTDIHHLLTHIRYEERFQTNLFKDTLFQDLTIFETIGIQGLNIRNIIRSLVRMIVIKNHTKIQQLQNLLYQEVHA